MHGLGHFERLSQGCEMCGQAVVFDVLRSNSEGADFLRLIDPPSALFSWAFGDEARAPRQITLITVCSQTCALERQALSERGRTEH